MAAECPRDGTELVEVERSGVRVDACRTCRGVWLDRGELEKLLERESETLDRRDHDDEEFLREITGGGSKPAKPGLDKDTAKRVFEEYRGYKHGSHDSHGSHGHGKKRKKSFLEQILD